MVLFLSYIFCCLLSFFKIFSSSTVFSLLLIFLFKFLFVCLCFSPCYFYPFFVVIFFQFVVVHWLLLSHGCLVMCLLLQQWRKLKMAYRFLWEIHCRASPAICDHTVLPATWQENVLRFNSSIQPSTRFTYPRGMEGWVEVGGSLYWDGLPV